MSSQAPGAKPGDATMSAAPLDDREARLSEFAARLRAEGPARVTDRYLQALSFLHAEQPRLFEQAVLRFETYSRVYFAQSAQEIDRSGRSTQPHEIPGTALWALTNMRADQKRVTLARLAVALGYAPTAAAAFGNAL